jgi:uncharacterized protein YegL
MRKFRKEPNGELMQRVLVNMILDKSGSMATRWEDVVGGYNSYLNELKADDKTDYRMTVVLFDTNKTVVCEDEPLASLEPMTVRSYTPSGGTALYDAVGETVSQAKTEDVTKVVTVIMTDGEENSSRNWTYDRVTGLINSKEQEGVWTFIFMGETMKVAVQGQAMMGAYAANTFQYNQAKPSASYRSLAANLVRFANSDAVMSTDLGIDDADLKAVGTAVTPKRPFLKRR